MAVWLPVVGWEKLYLVSDEGEVFSVRSERLLTKSIARAKSYYTVALTKNGKSHNILVHQIVAAAFLGPATGPLVRHLDDDGHNNKASNLLYGDTRDNIADAQRNGRRRVISTTCTKGHERTLTQSGWHCRTCDAKRTREMRSRNG